MPAENPQSPSQISLQLLSCYSIPPPDAADCGLFKAREPTCLFVRPSVQVIDLIYCQILSSHLPDPSVYEYSILYRIEDIMSKMITAAASAKITAKTSHHHSVHQYLGVWGPKVMDGGFFVLRASRCSRSAASIHSCSNFSVATRTSCMKAYPRINQNGTEGLTCKRAVLCCFPAPSITQPHVSTSGLLASSTRALWLHGVPKRYLPCVVSILPSAS